MKKVLQSTFFVPGQERLLKSLCGASFVVNYCIDVVHATPCKQSPIKITLGTVLLF